MPTVQVAKAQITKFQLPEPMFDMATKREYYEGQVAAEILDVDYRTIVNMTKDGRLRGFNKTRAYGVCVWKSSLETFLASREIVPTQ